jgi:hypothetical protein
MVSEPLLKRLAHRVFSLKRRGKGRGLRAALLLLIAPLSGCRTTCYAPVVPPPGNLPPEARAALLDDAVRRDEVPPDTARTARRLIAEDHEQAS